MTGVHSVWRAAVVSIVVGTAHAQGDDDAGDDDFAFSAQERERCGEVLQEMPNLVRFPPFSAVPEEQRVGLFELWTMCAIELRDDRAAYEALGWFAPVSPEPDFAYSTRVALALQLGEAQAAVDAIDSWAQASPSGLNRLELGTIGRLLRQASTLRGGDEIVFGIHETLYRAGYAPVEPLDNDQFLRVDHARLLLERGRVDDAIRRLGDPDELTFPALVVVSAERLFDPVLAPFEPLDYVAEAAQRVDEAREAIAEYPRLLKARYRYVKTLRDAGQNAAALDETDRMLADIAADPDAFDDVDDYLNWIHNDRAYALYSLDRPAEGRAAMATGADTDENGGPNVSQSINLGLLLADEGRWEESIAALARMGLASLYGEMFAGAVRVCAAAATGNDTMIAVELTFLRANASENFPALQQALVCAGEFDEAAELYVRRLADPMARAAALTALQLWARDPAPMRAREEMLQRLEIVQSDAKVQRALAAVGYSRVIPLPIAYWGNRY
jgi:tetratricopeptide (TPR) repeat protein